MAPLVKFYMSKVRVLLIENDSCRSLDMDGDDFYERLKKDPRVIRGIETGRIRVETADQRIKDFLLKNRVKVGR